MIMYLMVSQEVCIHTYSKQC